MDKPLPTGHGQTVAGAFRAFAIDESGATAIEYALIAGCIFIAIVAAVGTIAPKLSSTFTNVASNLK